MQQHFIAHKQKYISFLVVAILVFLVSYAGRNTEALGGPMGDMNQEMMMAQTSRRCPPRILHMRDMVHFFHPCLMEFLHVDPTPVPQAPAQVEVPADNATSTEATSTTETATTTDATSTPAGSETNESDLLLKADASAEAGE
jgi:hypothetical protein